MPPQITAFFTRMGSGIKGFSAAQRTLAIIGVAVLVLGTVALTSWLAKPAYTPLFSGLKDTDANGIVEQLRKDNVPYEIANGGSTILVPEEKVYDERLKAAAAGLPSAAATGYSLLDKLGVTSSEFQQSVTYKRALEGELATTIQAMEGVKAAAVRLAIPEKSVFVDKTPDATASVFVETQPGTTLSPDKVQAVVHLTSAAIENLKPANVSVVDSQGNVLSTVGGGAAGSSSKQAGEYQERTTDSVKAVLDSVVGPGNATVAVAADVTGESAQQRSETFTAAADVPALSESTKSETYTGTGGGAAGVLGPDNIAVPGGTNGNSTFDSTDSTKNNAVNKVTEDRIIPQGAVKRQTISVAINQAAAAGVNLASVRSLVTSAAGADPARGDVVTVEVLPFSTAAADNAAASLAEAKAEAEAAQQGELMKTLVIAGSILLAALALIVVALISWRRRQRREPVDLGIGIEYPVAPVTALEPAPATSAIQLPLAEPLPLPGADVLDGERRRAQIEAMVAESPARTADYLRGLMDERQSV
ncbi:flagellar M-ring protein FliF [Pseudarthrobacter chlorophenolicus A6]|uniref:Flagellar M-ring protein n=1 Tax=Pseudarthrobacter chlorophenolicus (strain ATCC 700700 / DSM 12829 / CIP 107037 / JCM 12360 / KCTC 9906 / NCIMB 13794 / A6) TaxID=452863 RepID=B8HEK7_PSECP|nr:flagellar basal-body MS-ring/collar protein FliF [Pseudarthrobacter chlorophenolicus]ACL40952.1 flagellar M-ring protein FliF [Pseudarthrobacter chlorophenolicus A6]SDQ72327.1 flagellar M-ring protein FliF [Pseudarthrobacter chlorophenolicus]